MYDDTCQLLFHSCNTIGLPFGTHLGKTLKATDGLSRQEVWELTIGDSGKFSEPRLRGDRWRILRGMSWEQA